jgi:hypothetical protein
MEVVKDALSQLDEKARRQLEEEQRRHSDALFGLRAVDSDQTAEEFNRHLDRVQEILQTIAIRYFPAVVLWSLCA